MKYVVLGITVALVAACGSAPDSASLREVPGGARARLDTALRASVSDPVRIVFAGSSTTAGTGASSAEHRYVDRLVDALQTRHSSGGDAPPVLTRRSARWARLSDAAGIHAYNVGQPGATSSDYLTGATLARVAGLEPAVVVHMVGANDYGSQNDPDVFAENVLATMEALDARAESEVVHVLVHQHQRLDTHPSAFAWDDYGARLRDLAARDPERVLFVDASDDFADRGVTSGDPSDLVGSDKVHLTDAGHRLLAEVLLAEAFGGP